MQQAQVSLAPSKPSFQTRIISQRFKHSTMANVQSQGMEYVRNDNTRFDPKIRFDMDTPLASTINDTELEDVNVTLKDADANTVLAWAASAGPVAMISSFGAQAAVLLHMANRMSPGLPVVAIDTGFLPPETYRYMEELKERLDLNLIVVNNSEWSAARIEAIHGKLWEKDDEQSHKLYGSLTKTTPLAAALDAIEPRPLIMLSGVRGTQTAARAKMPRVSRQGGGRLKVLPLLRMSDEEVHEHYLEHDLPFHPLVAEGYVTIGDWHSSRALKPGETAEDARKTRFGGKFEECGLHVDTPETTAAPAETRSAFDILEPTAVHQKTGLRTHLVKKKLEDGEMCRKCKDVQNKLEKDGLMDVIGGVSIADMTDAASDGLTLASHFDEKKAPFFIVQEGDEPWKVIYSYGQWKRAMKKSQAEAAGLCL